jgi:hypothetical protein
MRNYRYLSLEVTRRFRTLPAALVEVLKLLAQERCARLLGFHLPPCYREFFGRRVAQTLQCRDLVEREASFNAALFISMSGTGNTMV